MRRLNRRRKTATARLARAVTAALYAVRANPALALPLVIALCAIATLAACVRPPSPSIGDARHGAALIAATGCGSCHSIPGVPGAGGRVGPPLDNIGSRTVLAGLLPNTPDNMVTWLKAPQAIVPGNAMPSIGLTDDDAKDIAAYLLTLR
jgi:cytochrome c2